MNVFDTGLDVRADSARMDFQYGEDVYGPVPERRTLDAIRSSLRQPDCEGPETVYAIAMDVAKKRHRAELEKRMLLFGVVTYASGRLGDEPVRSQGHVHRVSVHSGWSPPELYEIWSGKAYIYMQESAGDDPGRCFAVLAGPGDKVVVPPGWAHATISADPQEALTFGAWCDREYGFEYDEVRRHRGLAWYPLVQQDGQLEWARNESYRLRELTIKRPGDYGMLNVERGVPIYRQFEADPDRFQWVSEPALKKQAWINFTP
ncbi:glucose-6-phosphate isomerase family protein [Paenibacillus hodogayensis]|uniref:glucose-6-phosphate isomerase n=1 Tax=Paenibacillus hodogayensis TaxID=279208 RepID=A0ABV5VXV6_9BACL